MDKLKVPLFNYASRQKTYWREDLFTSPWWWR